jgi:hypothetical protein
MIGPAIPSGNPATLTPIGVRIWYGDSVVETFRAAQSARWSQSKATDVQIVTVYYSETYQSWNHYTNEWETFPYRKIYHSQDYYWLDGGHLYAGNASEVPVGLSAGSVKAGATLTDATWRERYTAAYADMRGA